MKKLLSILAAGLCPLLLCSCQSVVTAGSAPASVQATAAPQAQGTLALAYTDAGFNPYLSADTLTRENAGLVFEPLVSITPDMDVDYHIAQTIDTSGTSVIIQIRSGCYFSDDTEITAADAAASIEAARASSTYAARFANVTDVQVQGSAVCLTLSAPDSLFVYLLDIPVMKAGETSAASPTASGRYTYGADGASLVKNDRAAFPDGGPDTISLVKVSGADALVSGLAKGTVDLYTQADTGSDISSINAGESYYRTNNLVYLGVNAGSGNVLCSTPQGRQLLSALCGRNELASRAYGSCAYAATGAVNSYYPCVRGRQTILASADSSGLDAGMNQLGYTKDAASGIYQDSRGRQAAVSLLVYGANSYKLAAAQQLAEQWQAAGIQVTLTQAASFDEYVQQVQSGNFELYIGEVKLYNNMDLTPFWSGETRYGLAPSEALLAAYDAFRQNAGTAADFETAFAAEMPFIPLLWHSGTVVTSRRVSGVSASVSSVFYSLQNLQVSP
jgi:peptide/nickel transport system substrate-binding protein